MRRIFLAVVVVTLMASSAMARPWSYRSGGSLGEAELVDVTEGNVILKRQDGSEITVPLNKLSLRDVRYVGDTLRAAEAAVSGKGDTAKTDTPAAEKSHTTPPLQTGKMDNAGKSGKVIGIEPGKEPLRYGWKQGQSYVYRVKIVGERGDYSEYFAGDVTYQVKSIADDEIELAMARNVKREQTETHGRVVILGGRHVRFLSTTEEKARDVSITVSPFGQVLRVGQECPLPYLLGDVSELMIEPLAAVKDGSWTVTGNTGVTVVTNSYPYHRFTHAQFRDGVPATEKAVYTIQERTDKLLTVSKRYELTTASVINGKPRFEVAGNGTLVFDLVRGVPSKLKLAMNVTVRDINRTEETPLQVSYRLLDEEEVRRMAKEAEDAKKEKDRPLNAQDAEKALADLATSDANRLRPCLKLLTEKGPPQPNAKVAKALESLMLTSDNAQFRAQAATALKKWSVPESVPALVTAITNDSWPPVKTAAIEAITQYKPESAINAIAAELPNIHTRHVVTGALKAIGPAAEDAVLLHIADKDDWTRAAVCEILKVIGTKKSLSALEKATQDHSWMVNKPAAAAASAIKIREQQGGKK